MSEIIWFVLFIMWRRGVDWHSTYDTRRKCQDGARILNSPFYLFTSLHIRWLLHPPTTITEKVQIEIHLNSLISHLFCEWIHSMNAGWTSRIMLLRYLVAKIYLSWQRYDRRKQVSALTKGLSMLFLQNFYIFFRFFMQGRV